MTITIETASLDERGRLVHHEDAVAQACLAFVHLERALEELGHRLTDIAGVRVLCLDESIAEEVVDVVTERLRDEYSAATVECSSVSALALPGMLVALRACVHTAHTTDPTRTHEKEPR